MDTYDLDRDLLKTEILQWINKDDSYKMKILKKEHIQSKQFLHNREYYKDKIFYNIDKDVVDKIDLELELCETSEQNDLWNYFLINTTSYFNSGGIFRRINYLLREKNTGKYLGVLQISSDVYSMGLRDEFIGWSAEEKKSRINYLVNIKACVGLQPMSHNLNIGKLLTMLVFSKRVMTDYYNKYGHYYAVVCTLSLYGRSIQYERLKEIKYIGNTKGFGSQYISKELYEKMRNYLKKYHSYYLEKLDNMSSSKMRTLQYINNILDLNHGDLINHGHSRGIYCGFVNEKSKDFLQCKTDKFELDIDSLQNIDDIVVHWKDRWARKRFEHLYTNRKLKIMFELKDMDRRERNIENTRQMQYSKYHTDDEFKLKVKQNNKEYYDKNKKLKREKLTTEEVTEILNCKNTEMKSKEVAQYLSCKFNKNISENIVKNYWCGRTKIKLIKL